MIEECCVVGYNVLALIDEVHGGGTQKEYKEASAKKKADIKKKVVLILRGENLPKAKSVKVEYLNACFREAVIRAAKNHVHKH